MQIIVQMSPKKKLDKKIWLCIIGITLLKGGDEIGEKGWILFDGLADQESKEGVKEDGAHSVGAYSKGH